MDIKPILKPGVFSRVDTDLYPWNVATESKSAVETPRQRHHDRSDKENDPNVFNRLSKSKKREKSGRKEFSGTKRAQGTLNLRTPSPSSFLLSRVFKIKGPNSAASPVETSRLSHRPQKASKRKERIEGRFFSSFWIEISTNHSQERIRRV